MKEFSYTIKDAMGLHARPAGILAKQAASYKSDIKISNGTKTGDAKRIISIMQMAIKCGETVSFTVSGEDEDKAAEEILKFLQEKV